MDTFNQNMKFSDKRPEDKILVIIFFCFEIFRVE
jgi:hypothetical protein